jgi:hypothetical protein
MEEIEEALFAGWSKEEVAKVKQVKQEPEDVAGGGGDG